MTVLEQEFLERGIIYFDSKKKQREYAVAYTCAADLARYAASEINKELAKSKKIKVKSVTHIGDSDVLVIYTEEI